MIMMKNPIYSNSFVIANVTRLSDISQSVIFRSIMQSIMQSVIKPVRPLSKAVGGYGTMILMLTALQTPIANAQVDQSTLGDMQLRIIAIENTLRDLNARVENDLFDLRQNLESGSAAEDVLRRVDEKLNNILSAIILA